MRVHLWFSLFLCMFVKVYKSHEKYPKGMQTKNGNNQFGKITIQINNPLNIWNLIISMSKSMIHNPF